MNTPIIDSDFTIEAVLAQNPNFLCPAEILNQIVVITVKYYSFDGLLHAGQIAIHTDVADDVRGAFQLLLDEKFPIESAIPMSAPKFHWDDDISTQANNTSGFNYRRVRNMQAMSNHAFGRALDINPRLNPYFPGNQVFPPNAQYDPSQPGSILASSSIVAYFQSRGWSWDGTLTTDPDYQHFEKPLKH